MTVGVVVLLDSLWMRVLQREQLLVKQGSLGASFPKQFSKDSRREKFVSNRILADNDAGLRFHVLSKILQGHGSGVGEVPRE